jgi:hypothetical protein
MTSAATVRILGTDQTAAAQKKSEIEIADDFNYITRAITAF